MTALSLTQERKNAEAEYATSAFDYARDPIGSNAWCIFWKGWQARAVLAQSPVSAKIDLPPSMIARTEDIRLAHANPTSRPRSYLVRDVQSLLAHIALLGSAAPVSAEGLTDTDRIDYIERRGVAGSIYRGVGSVDTIVHLDEYRHGGLRWAIDCMIEREPKAAENGAEL